MSTNDDATAEVDGLKVLMIMPKRWGIDEDGDVFAGLGRAAVVVTDEGAGLYRGDAGELQAYMVGSEENGNQRVTFSLFNEDVESLYDVNDLDTIEREG